MKLTSFKAHTPAEFIPTNAVGDLSGVRIGVVHFGKRDYWQANGKRQKGTAYLLVFLDEKRKLIVPMPAL